LAGCFRKNLPGFAARVAAIAAERPAADRATGKKEWRGSSRAIGT